MGGYPVVQLRAVLPRTVAPVVAGAGIALAWLGAEVRSLALAIGTLVAISLARATLRRPDLVARVLGPMLPRDMLLHVDTTAPVFALTLDDGPHPATTTALLDVLDHHGARATFFVLGERARVEKALVARIRAEGHELGNHLLRDEPSIGLAPEEFSRQLAETGALLAEHGGARWFRPGSGRFTPRMLRTAAGQGLRCVLGTAVGAHSRQRLSPDVAGGHNGMDRKAALMPRRPPRHWHR